MSKRIVGKVGCKLCGRLVGDNFQQKWRHMLKWHESEVFSNLLPMVLNPRAAYEKGFQLGRTLRDGFVDNFVKGGGGEH